MDEADAFWALCAMVELVLPSGMYSPQLHGLTVELRVLSDLLSRQLGSLTSHLQKAGISTESLPCTAPASAEATAPYAPAPQRVATKAMYFSDWSEERRREPSESASGGSGESNIGCTTSERKAACNLRSLERARSGRGRVVRGCTG